MSYEEKLEIFNKTFDLEPTINELIEKCNELNKYVDDKLGIQEPKSVDEIYELYKEKSKVELCELLKNLSNDPQFTSRVGYLNVSL